ncbi:hypothetical protein THRCLA_10172 [Thraustotheca clavata]|uniref:Uncharacterized protein n=1 Tax=Thraustotheca clavata TaxID=74557 RepID=A0A1V9YS62_9STRA|nr:hypothetical protein THRCLA_10172 [Thraustotheca clavata]
MKKMLEVIMQGMADETMKIQASVIEFTANVHRKKKNSFDHEHLQYIYNVFHDVDTILACSAVDDPSRGFLTQFCNALSEYFYASTTQTVDEEGLKIINSCKDLWHRFLDYAHTSESTPDFVLLTCIWRNITRLCTTFRVQLIELEPELATSLLQSISTTIAAQATCLEIELESNDIAINLIKTLRLLIKAYQSIFACFVDYMPQEKYLATLLYVGEISKNIFHKQLKLKRYPEDLFQACEQLVDDVLSLISKTSTQIKEPSSRLSFFYRQKLKECLETPATSTQDFFIVLALLKLYPSDGNTNVQLAKDLDSIFLSYRTVLNTLSSPRKSYIMEYLIDSIIHLVFVAPPSSSVYKLQLQVLSYSFHENIYQQVLCQHVWRGAFCSIWKEGSKLSRGGDQFINCLFKILSTPSNLQVRARNAILDLLANCFDVFTKSQRAKCMHGISMAIESICNDGPDHEATPSLFANLDLLYHLIGARSAIQCFSEPEFIQTHLTSSVECLGAAVDILCQGTDGDRSLENALWRIIDGTLLICRAILLSVEFPAEHPQSESINKVTSCINTVVVGVVDLLSTAIPQSKSTGSRVLESCIEIIIHEFQPSVKQNVNNQYIALLQSTVRIVSAQKWLHFHITKWLRYFVSVQIPQDASEDNLVVANLLCEIFTKLLAYPSPWPVIALTLEAIQVFLSTSNVADTTLDCIHTLLLKHSTMLHEYFTLIQSPNLPQNNLSDRLSQLVLDQDSTFETTMSSISIRVSPSVPAAKRPPTIDDLLQTCLAIKKFKPSKNPRIEAAYTAAATALDSLLNLHSQL